MFRGSEVRRCKEHLEENPYERVCSDLEGDGRASIYGVCREGTVVLGFRRYYTIPTERRSCVQRRGVVPLRTWKRDDTYMYQ